MRKNLALPAAILVTALAYFAMLGGMPAGAQPAPGNFAQSYAVAAAVAASGPASSARSVSADKTYQVVSATTAGSGSTVVQVEGSMSTSGPWASVGSPITVTTSTTPAAAGINSADRWVFVRPNATTLTGTGATYTLTIGY